MAVALPAEWIFRGTDGRTTHARTGGGPAGMRAGANCGAANTSNWVDGWADGQSGGRPTVGFIGGRVGGATVFAVLGSFVRYSEICALLISRTHLARSIRAVVIVAEGTIVATAILPAVERIV